MSNPTLAATAAISVAPRERWLCSRDIRFRWCRRIRNLRLCSSAIQTFPVYRHLRNGESGAPRRPAVGAVLILARSRDLRIRAPRLDPSNLIASAVVNSSRNQKSVSACSIVTADGSVLRIRYFQDSAKGTIPTGSEAIRQGLAISALAEGPPAPANPSSPVPASVETTLSGLTLRIRCCQDAVT